MKFIVVNHRTPLGSSGCAECSQSLGSGYLKVVSTRRQYCDYHCYLRYEARSLPTPWLTADHAASLEMMTSFAAAACCYSIAIASAALRVVDLAAAGVSLTCYSRSSHPILRCVAG